MIRLIIASLVLLVFSATSVFAQFYSVEELSPISISANTGEKPQSKVWFYEGKFWTVLPDSEGTHLWRLDGKDWKKALRISSETTSKVDCKVVGNVTHILIFHEPTLERPDSFVELASLEYDPLAKSYSHWSERDETVSLTLDESVETASIDVDTKGRMWLAYERTTKIRVRWSDAPYTNWSDEIEVADGVKNDDICMVVAFSGKIGVFWSNQNSNKFRFRTRNDGDNPEVWSRSVENVRHTTDGNTVGGLADDHMNMAVASDGTLYCAIKTSYRSIEQPLLGLFVRRPTGVWDNLYNITKEGLATRPIVILNEVERVIRVIYTDDERNGGGNIIYKESSIDNINFEDDAHTLIEGVYNNVTSTKENFREEIVILASNNSQAVGVLARTAIIPLPVELISFTARLVGDDALLQWKTASEQDNDYFSIESSTDGRVFTPIGMVPGNGTTQLQRNYTFTDENVSRYRSDNIYYRLRQVDFSGEYEFSPIRYLRSPSLPETIALKAFPSPFADFLQVQINSNETQDASLILYSAQGRAVFSQQPTLKRGLNNITLSGLNLSGGIYFLIVRTADEQQMVKVIRE